MHIVSLTAHRNNSSIKHVINKILVGASRYMTSLSSLVMMKLIEPLKGPKQLANIKLEKFNTKLSCLVHIPLNVEWW